MDPIDNAFETLVQGPNGEPGFMFRPWFQCHRTSDSAWHQPVAWNAEAKALGQRFRVLCGPNCDPFNPEVPADLRAELLRLVKATQHLDWLVITSHITVAGEVLKATLPNLWLGVPVATQAQANDRVPALLSTPARIRFVVASVRESIDLTALPFGGQASAQEPVDTHASAPDLSASAVPGMGQVLEKIYAPLRHINAIGQYAWGRFDGELHTAHIDAGLDWVICVGATGPDAQPMHPDWVRGIRDQCRVEGIHFMFAQWGDWAPGYGCFASGEVCFAISRDGQQAPQAVRVQSPSPGPGANGWSFVHRAGARAAGRRLDGRTHDASPVVASL